MNINRKETKQINTSALNKFTVRQSLIVGLSGRISCVFSHTVLCKLKYMIVEPLVYQICWRLSIGLLVGLVVLVYLKARDIDIVDLFSQYGV